MTDTTTTREAGPALDAEISRVVFAEPAEVFGGVAHLINDVGRVPAYSTSIEAAWLVVDRMRERGYGFVIRDTLLGDWAPEFIPNGRAHGEHITDRSPARGICHVALRALAAHQEAPGHG